MQERRKNVRVRPAGDYDIGIDFGDGLVKVKLPVLDAAVGGVGLELSEQLVSLAAETEIQLGVTLPGVPRFETLGIIRYTQGRIGGRCGVHLNKMAEDQQTALGKAVSELLERGHSA